MLFSSVYSAMICPARAAVLIIARYRVFGKLFVQILLRSPTHGRREEALWVSDRTDPPIGSPSASAALPSAGGRGRAGCLPKRGVRVGVNG